MEGSGDKVPSGHAPVLTYYIGMTITFSTCKKYIYYRKAAPSEITEHKLLRTGKDTCSQECFCEFLIKSIAN